MSALEDGQHQLAKVMNEAVRTITTRELFKLTLNDKPRASMGKRESTKSSCDYAWCAMPAVVRLPASCPSCARTTVFHGCEYCARRYWLDAEAVSCTNCRVDLVRGEPVAL